MTMWHYVYPLHMSQFFFYATTMKEIFITTYDSRLKMWIKNFFLSIVINPVETYSDI